MPVEPVPAETRATTTTRSAGAAAAWIAVLFVGAVMVAVGMAIEFPMAARVIGGLVGVFVMYTGLDRALRHWMGRPVETDLWLALAWVVMLVGAAVFADFLPLSESYDSSLTLTDPSRATPDLLSAHPFGTDSQALDILGGVIYGARVSLQVSLIAVLVGTVLGGLIGIAAGYFGGRLDSIIGVLTDSTLAFPPLILLLALVTAIEPSVLSIALALALLGIPTYTRLARANTLTLVHREFVVAARTLGAGHTRIILRELVPNVLRPLLSYSFIIVAVLIVAEASLSFLGVGISRPTPTWGNMISAGQGELRTSPHLVFIPSAVMFVTVYALNRLGDKARQFWDPRDSAL
ncbi:MAG: ABC transporter permease [Acidimicrobiales bacterium]